MHTNTYRTYSADDPGQSGKDGCYKFLAQTWLTPEDYAELYQSRQG